MQRVVVLGAGFGGLEVAHNLRGHARVTLVDQSETFLMGLAMLQRIDGRRKAGDGERAIARAAGATVDVMKARATKIDLQTKRVETSAGALDYDKLVIALGARLEPVVGHNLYSPEGVGAFHRDLAKLGKGGRVLIAVSSMPFKCPAAPYEASILAKLYLDARGVEASVTIVSPEPHPLPVAGKACGDSVREWVEERGVRVINGTTADQLSETFDLVATVPHHKGPEILASSGLALEGGWLVVDRETLATSDPNVFGIGDCTLVKLLNGKPLTKAGVMAEAEGRVVARRILGEDARFDGKGGCFLEMGRGEAAEIVGEFFAPNGPIVVAKSPSTETLRKKEAFEAERLARWFHA